MSENKYRIRPLWRYYVVDQEYEEHYWFLFKKVRKVWKPLTIMGHLVFGWFMPAIFETKKEARAFIKRIEEDIEYIN